MYKKGDLLIATSPCETFAPDSWQCEEVENHRHHGVMDNRNWEAGKQIARWVQGPVVYLPESWDSWVIGGPEEIRAMITDLQEALKKLEEVPKAA